MKKTIKLLVLVLALSLVLFGCNSTDKKAGGENSDKQKDEKQSEEQNKKEEVKKDEEKEDEKEDKKESSADSHYPVTIKTYDTDHNEIELVFEKAPEKVLVAYQNSIEIMLKLGLADKVVASFGLDGEVSDDLKEEFAKLNYLKESPTKEAVLAYEPDFILGWYSVFLDQTYNPVSFWQERGVKTYMSMNSGARPKGTIQKVEDEMQDILNIGKIFNVEDKAQKIVDETLAEVKKIENYVKDVDKKQIAILENQKDNYRVYGGDTLAGDVAMSGGAEIKIGKERSENISAEQLIAADPDAIFMVWFNGYNTPEDAIKDIVDNPALASLSAVKNKQVFAVNLSYLYCSGLHTIEGIKLFANSLYPELN